MDKVKEERLNKFLEELEELEKKHGLSIESPDPNYGLVVIDKKTGDYLMGGDKDYEWKPWD
jgi:hypothetical protein